MKYFKVLSILFALIFFGITCTNVKKELSTTEINLKWVKNYPGEKVSIVKKGLMWSMAFAGAMLPKNDIAKGIQVVNDSIILIDLKYLGFDKNALKQWEKIINYTKNTDEYKLSNSIDLGRFLVFSIYTSWHYYAITGVPDSIQNILDKPISDTNWQTYPISHSGVANGLRIIKYLNNKDIQKNKFVALEGSGEINDGSFKVETFEVIDLMKNGQLRYLIYDKYGKLAAASPKLFGEAGKPTKCMWCHEGHFTPLVVNNTDLIGYKTGVEFSKEMRELNELLLIYRNNIHTALNYKKHQEHQYSEWLYITFMEPNANRLAQEWDISVQQVKERLKTLSTHYHREYEFMGELYNRDDVEKFSTVKSLPIPLSAREPNLKEPNIFKEKK